MRPKSRLQLTIIAGLVILLLALLLLRARLGFKSPQDTTQLPMLQLTGTPPVTGLANQLAPTIIVPPVVEPEVSSLTIYFNKYDFSQDAISRLVESFGFQPNPTSTLTDTYYWESEAAHLYLKPNAHFLNYQINDLTSLTSQAPDPATAAVRVNRFLQSHGLAVGPLSTTQTRFYSTQLGELAEVSRAEANVTKIFQTYELDGLLVATNEHNLHALEALVTSNQVVSFTLTLIRPEAIGEVNLISAQAAGQLLRNNQGILISAELDQDSYGASEIAFSQAQIRSADLTYLYLPESQDLHPYYLFTGTAPNHVYSNKLMTIKYLVPAYKQ